MSQLLLAMSDKGLGQVVLVGKTYSPTRVDLKGDSKRILLHGDDTYKLGNISEGQKDNDVVTVSQLNKAVDVLTKKINDITASMAASVVKKLELIPYTGAINSINQSYLLSVPIIPDSLLCFYQGGKVDVAEYTLVVNTVNFTFAPQELSTLEFYAIKL